MPEAHPINKISSLTLWYAGLEHYDWLEILDGQSECSKRP